MFVVYTEIYLYKYIHITCILKYISIHSHSPILRKNLSKSDDFNMCDYIYMCIKYIPIYDMVAGQTIMLCVFAYALWTWEWIKQRVVLNIHDVNPTSLVAQSLLVLRVCVRLVYTKYIRCARLKDIRSLTDAFSFGTFFGYR